MKKKVKNIGDHLREYGINPSLQRIKIMEYLISNKVHPNAEMIYRALIREIPTLSKTTVYNTLGLFTQKGIVAALLIEENEVRYDAELTPHGHFQCRECMSILNIGIDKNVLNPQYLEGFQVREHHIYFKGVCDRCLEKLGMSSEGS